MKFFFLIIIILVLFTCKSVNNQKDYSKEENYIIKDNNLLLIKYDDGSSEGSWSPWSDIPGVKKALKFTLRKKPFIITKVAFFITQHGKPNTKFNVKIYSENMITENPENELLSEQVISSGTNGNEWVEIDLQKYNLKIEQSVFFVAMEWLTSPGKDGSNAQAIGYDMESRSIRRSWSNWTDTNKGWIKEDDKFKGNIMIRVLGMESSTSTNTP
jgi:hypothetical protein